MKKNQHSMIYICVNFHWLIMKLFIYPLFFTFSCAPVFTADINGYILDIETYEGIPSVELRFYEHEPKNFGDKNYTYQTSTGNDSLAGFFSQSLIWSDYLAKYGKKGDVIDLYFTVVHPNYQAQIESAVGIVSSTTNTIPTVLLKSLNAYVENIQGSIYTQFGPENGVQVALYLGEEDIPYARTTSQNINGLDGLYSFEDISWWDPALSGTIMATVKMIDPRYSNPIPATVSQEIFNQKSTDFMDDIIVEVSRPTIFEAEIKGHTSFLIETTNTAEYRPIAGIEIELEWYYDDENQSNPKHSFVRTDENGDFTATINWEDPIADTDNSIPPEADQIEVHVSYPSGGSMGFSYDLSPYNDTFIIRSWIDNTLPSAYEYIPLPEE